MATRKPKAPEVPPAKPKAKGKPKAKAVPVTEPPPTVVEKPPQTPEDEKIQQYFQNPKSKVSGKYKDKILEWIAMYELIGPAHDVWKKPNPMTVWEKPNHEYHIMWNHYMEGISIRDAEALLSVALDNRITALEQMLASWIALKLRSVAGQPDLMVRMLDGTA